MTEDRPKTNLWYFEQMGPTGNWSPCTMPTRPATKEVNGVLRMEHTGSQGARVRRIKQVDLMFKDADLNQLQVVYGRDD